MAMLWFGLRLGLAFASESTPLLRADAMPLTSVSWVAAVYLPVAGASGPSVRATHSMWVGGGARRVMVAVAATVVGACDSSVWLRGDVGWAHATVLLAWNEPGGGCVQPVLAAVQV